MRKKKLKRGLSLLLAGTVALSVLPNVAFADNTSGGVNGSSKMLQNGDFESSTNYWNTTATDGAFEKFGVGTTAYGSFTLSAYDGSTAVELNANQESTLYQVVNTTPSSLYEWGLAHGARSNSDTMALIIGPNQENSPKKASPSSNDQFMSMVDWIYGDGKNNYSGLASAKGSETAGKLYGPYTVYCADFNTKGDFDSTSSDSNFSATKDEDHPNAYTVWIMNAKMASSDNNPWYTYGLTQNLSSTTDKTVRTATQVKGTETGSQCFYQVPAGQTETIFAFVSVYPSGSLGNFLDAIQFKLYQRISAATTSGGNVDVAGTNGTDKNVTYQDALTGAYAEDGGSMTFSANLEDEDTTFAGIYLTTTNDDETTETEFIKYDESDSEHWSVSDDGKTYTYTMTVSQPTDAQFVFLKNPTVLYDANGGKLYDCGQNSGDDSNVYSFKATLEDGEYSFVEPYVSHAAVGPEGEEDSWKFEGWKVYDEDGLVGNGELLDGAHTVACSYIASASNATDSDSVDTKKQTFTIVNSDASDVFTASDAVPGRVTYETEEQTWYGPKKTAGLTMVAQWRWLQSFVPQIEGSDGNFYNSGAALGNGSLSIEGVNDNTISTENVRQGANGVLSYFAENGETVKVTAPENDDYTFLGWYDEDGNLLSDEYEYHFTTTRNTTATVYPRYAKKNGSSEVGSVTFTVNDATLGEVSNAGTQTTVYGNTVTSVATANSGYTFVKWVDSDGNEVTSSDNVTVSGNTLTVTMGQDTQGKTYQAVFIQNVDYTVNVYKQNTDGEYELDSQTSETVQALPGTQITEEDVEKYTTEHYALNKAQSTSLPATVTADGQNTINLSYDLDKYTFSYDLDDGTGAEGETYENQEAYYAGNAAAKAAPTKKHYKFAGWEITDAEGNVIGTINAGDPIPTTSGNLTLKATWTQVSTDPSHMTPVGAVYKVEHYKQQTDGSYKLMEDETQMFVGKIGETVSVPTETYDNYQLDETADGSVLSGEVSNVTTDAAGNPQYLTLKAYYKLDKHTISYDLDGGTGADGETYTDKEVYHGSELTAPAAPSKKHYEFTGWEVTDKEGNVIDTINAGGPIPTTSGDVTLKAKWTQVSTDPSKVTPVSAVYKVEHYKQQTDGSYKLMEDETQMLVGKIGETVSVPTEAYDNYQLDETADGSKLSGEVSNVTTDAAGNPQYLTLKAYYKLDKHTISYDLDGGTGADGETYTDKEVYHGSDLTAPAAPSKKHYEFTGWEVTDKEGNVIDTINAGGPIPTTSGDVTLKATWTQVSTDPSKVTPVSAVYKVEHYKQQTDGSYKLMEDETQMLVGKIGETVSVPAETYDNYQLDETADGSVLSGKVSNVTTDAAGNPQYLTLKAYYKLDKHTISYDLDGGTGADGETYTDKEVYHGSDLTAPAAPSKNHYRFDGWKIEGTDSVLQPGDAIPTESGANLVAQWTQISTDISKVTPKTAVYKVEHYKLRPDGSYVLDSTDFPLYGEIGSTVTAETETYIGYWINTNKSVLSGTVQNVTTDENGDPQYLTLKVFYDCNWKSSDNGGSGSGSGSSGSSHSTSVNGNTSSGANGVGPGYETTAQDTEASTAPTENDKAAAQTPDTNSTGADNRDGSDDANGTGNGVGSALNGDNSAVDAAKRDANPKTGDVTKTAMWFAMMGISMAGLAVSAISMKRKKEEQ